MKESKERTVLMTCVDYECNGNEGRGQPAVAVSFHLKGRYIFSGSHSEDNSPAVSAIVRKTGVEDPCQKTFLFLLQVSDGE